MRKLSGVILLLHLLSINATLGQNQITSFSVSSSKSQYEIVPFGLKTLIRARGDLGSELWVSDGNSLTEFYDIWSGSQSSFPNMFEINGEHVYFTADDELLGNELWRYSNLSGVDFVHDVLEGPVSSRPTRLKSFKGDLFFFTMANDDLRLLKTDGQILEIVSSFDKNPNGDAFLPISMISSKDFLYFLLAYDTPPYQLWVSDGTSNGTRRISMPINDNVFINYADLGEKQIFHLSNGIYSLIYDGTDFLWEFLALAPTMDSNQHLRQSANAIFNNEVYFKGFSIEHGNELWKTDGTKNRTFRVTDINIGPSNSIDKAFVSATKDALYFVADDGIHGRELWKSDGTSTGTMLVKDINPGAQGSQISELISIEDLVYFNAYHPASGMELWTSDGTESKTSMVADINPGTASSNPFEITANSTHIYFVADNQESGRQIWSVEHNQTITYNKTLFQSICDGETYSFGEALLTESGVYSNSSTSANGTDSTVTLNLVVNPTFSTDFETNICEDEEYVFGTEVISTSGTYTNIFNSELGCDSVVTMVINVSPAYESEIDVSICQGEFFEFNNQSLFNAGIYTSTFQSALLCDSTIILNLDVHSSCFGSAELSICEGETFEFGDRLLSEPGIYSETFINSVGLDSVVELTLDLHPKYDLAYESVICEGEAFVFGNLILEESGTYNQEFKSAYNCDSLVRLELIVQPTYEEQIAVTICSGENYNFGDEFLNTTGSYSDLHLSKSGCDSLILLDLIVFESCITEVSAVICDGETYLFGDKELIESGVYSDTIETQFGADSIVVVDLQGALSYDQVLDVTICENEEYIFGSQNLQEPGTFSQTFESIMGCDSTVTLNLMIYSNNYEIEIDDQFISVPVFENAEYQWFQCDLDSSILFGENTNSLLVTEEGSYSVRISVDGCELIPGCFNVSIPVGINGTMRSNSLKIFPVPAHNSITLDFENPFHGDIELINLTGMVILNKAVMNQSSATIDLNFPSGIYIVHLIREDGYESSVKLIIQN